MIALISGAAALLTGAYTVSVFNRKTNEDQVDPHYLKELTEAGQEALERVCSGSDPSDPKMSVCRKDMRTIFENSRKIIFMTNAARLSHPSDEELPVMLSILQKDHAKLRVLLFLVAIEAIVGKLGFGSITHYTREVLWTYGGELELLILISQKCGAKGTAI